jgi:Flp pilus assembly pilin Flp
MKRTLIFNSLEKKPKLISNKRGQVLVEFVLMLVVIASVSIALVKLVNGQLATRWKAAVETITKPTDTNIQIR